MTSPVDAAYHQFQLRRQALKINLPEITSGPTISHNSQYDDRYVNPGIPTFMFKKLTIFQPTDPPSILYDHSNSSSE